MSRVKLIATEGMVLTNGKSYGRIVYLGKNDSPDNWHEITEAEYQTVMEDSVPGEDSNPNMDTATEADPDSATEADYIAALREMGVQV